MSMLSDSTYEVEIRKWMRKHRPRACPGCSDDDELLSTLSRDGVWKTWRCLSCNTWWRVKADAKPPMVE